ncbi:hypothetical protein RRG08_008606 [Elysia crispata]|uniref:C-type lectin domain-containing protein n=1 Tax=Elysia crispata TaxID=231223 RepID=A0AAE1EB08_9GAST|nr:hypothetical protein RRG08_008606 [Elysia crispata]
MDLCERTQPIVVLTEYQSFMEPTPVMNLKFCADQNQPQIDMKRITTLAKVLIIGMFFQDGIGCSFQVICHKMTCSTADLECRRRGFDGLAIFKTPEEFNDVVRATVEERSKSSLWVGLKYYPGLPDLLYWIDSTPVASDLPWTSKDRIPRSYATCTLIEKNGFLNSLWFGYRKHAICGNHTKTFKTARGAVHHSLMPANIIYNSRNHHMKSHIECAVLCSSVDDCRAAWFDSKLLTCYLLKSGEYTGLEISPSAKTFVRERYIGGSNK